MKRVNDFSCGVEKQIYLKTDLLTERRWKVESGEDGGGWSERGCCVRRKKVSEGKMPAGQKTSEIEEEKKQKKAEGHPSSRLNLWKLSVTLSSLIITFAFTSDILGFQMLCSVPFRYLLKTVPIIITKSGARLTEFLVKPASGLLLRPNSQLGVDT